MADTRYPVARHIGRHGGPAYISTRWPLNPTRTDIVEQRAEIDADHTGPIWTPPTQEPR